MKIISKEMLNAMLEVEEKDGTEFLNPLLRQQEIDGLLYSIWKDGRSGKEYAVRETRTVFMGFNSNEDGKVQEFIDIVEREGFCKASWGVTGRTAHLMLAKQLEAQLSQYQFELDYDRYLCLAEKR